MTKVKVAVIGCGSIAKYRHIAEYAANPHVELVAFCDLVEERAVACTKQYGGVAYTDYKQLLQEVECDAISVCTANVDHAPITIVALEAKKHVLCEKPMAVSHDEAVAMIEAAKANGTFLMIGHNQRLMPPHIKAKEILQRGYLGRVLTFRTAFSHGGPEGWSVEGKESWFFKKERAFIGAMGDLGVHKVDLMRWLLDDEFVEVGAFVETLHKPDADVDDNAVCILRTQTGIVGTLVASWTHTAGEDNSTILYCERGVMSIGTDPNDQVMVQLVDGSTEKYRVGEIATNEEGGQNNSGVIAAFIDCILTDTPPSISGEEGMKSLDVVLAALKSAQNKTIVRIGE